MKLFGVLTLSIIALVSSNVFFGPVGTVQGQSTPSVSITGAPSSIVGGGTATLGSSVSGFPSGASLQYDWTGDGTSTNGTNKSTLAWVAPNPTVNAVTATMSLTVDDRNSEATATTSVDITVNPQSTTLPIAPAPTNVSDSSDSKTSFSISWNAASGVSHYMVSVSGFNAVRVSGGSHTASGLQCGRSYAYIIRAYGDGVTYRTGPGGGDNGTGSTLSCSTSASTTTATSTSTSAAATSAAGNAGTDVEQRACAFQLQRNRKSNQRSAELE